MGIHTSPRFWACLPSPFPSHPSRLIQSPCLSFLSHTANSCWPSILRMIIKVSLLLFPYVFLSFTFLWFSFKTAFLVFAPNMERWLSPFAFVMRSCDFVFSSLFFPAVRDTGSYRSSIKYGSYLFSFSATKRFLFWLSVLWLLFSHRTLTLIRKIYWLSCMTRISNLFSFHCFH